MDLSVIIHDRLVANAAVAAIVGTNVFLEESPDDADLPLIVYASRLGDAVDGSALVSPATVTVHGYASSDDTAQSLGAAISAALEGGGGVSGTTRLHCLSLEAWEEARSSEENLWGRLLAFSGTVVRG
ncbi:MAG: DUF3168 domain-containing protein [Rhizobiales bacterium]|nr:DUF3168 domain-containing protein [Hyphomicrobiales bacterium]